MMRKIVRRLALAASLGTLLAGGAWAQESEVLQSTRDTLARWVKTKQMISEEDRDWQLGREVLEQRVALLEREISTMETKIADARKSIADADAKRRDLASEKSKLVHAAEALSDAIGPLEAKARELVALLPDPIGQRVAPLSRRIPESKEAQARLSLSERFQNVIGIFNEVNKFNQDLTVASELRALPDGTTAEVTAVYVGLAQGYYVTADGRAAGIGEPAPGGWKWTPANELAGPIAEVIGVLQEGKNPLYVPLPVRIQ